MQVAETVHGFGAIVALEGERCDHGCLVEGAGCLQPVAKGLQIVLELLDLPAGIAGADVLTGDRFDGAGVDEAPYPFQEQALPGSRNKFEF